MDELDKKIVRCLSENARMTVKDIARRVCLTSPAVSERIRRMEKAGTIAGYTVLLGRRNGPGAIEALISVSVEPKDRDAFLAMAQQQPRVAQCFHVTGSHSFLVKVNCEGIAALEKLITTFQQLGVRPARSSCPPRWTGTHPWNMRRNCHDMHSVRAGAAAGRPVLPLLRRSRTHPGPCTGRHSGRAGCKRPL